MFRRLPLLLVSSFAIVLSTAACAGKDKVVVNYDAATDFATHDTYAWVTEDPIMRRADGAEKRIYNEKNERMLRDAIDLELAQKGMVKVDRESANTLVHFLVMTKNVESVSAAGGLGYGMTWSDQSKRAHYVEGTLVIVLFDAASGREIWNGTLSQALLGGSDPKEVIDEAVISVLSKFPPS